MKNISKDTLTLCPAGKSSDWQQINKGSNIDYRALIFDDNQEIRRLLWTVFDMRGYEVFTFPHPPHQPI